MYVYIYICMCTIYGAVTLTVLAVFVSSSDVVKLLASHVTTQAHTHTHGKGAVKVPLMMVLLSIERERERYTIQMSWYGNVSFERATRNLLNSNQKEALRSGQRVCVPCCGIPSSREGTSRELYTLNNSMQGSSRVVIPSDHCLPPPPPRRRLPRPPPRCLSSSRSVDCPPPLRSPP